MNAMLLKLQIQVGVGKSAGTPVFLSDNFAWLRREFGADLATPGAVFEGLSQPSCLLDRCNVLPAFIVAWTVSVMQRIKNTNPRLPGSSHDIQHVRNAVICFCDILDAIPYFASLGNEIVVWIDDDKRRVLFFKVPLCHALRGPPRLTSSCQAARFGNGICAFAADCGPGTP